MSLYVGMSAVCFLLTAFMGILNTHTHTHKVLVETQEVGFHTAEVEKSHMRQLKQT